MSESGTTIARTMERGMLLSFLYNVFIMIVERLKQFFPRPTRMGSRSAPLILYYRNHDPTIVIVSLYEKP
eukprot:scaffold5479_cov199-Amphora_coffeaeformis.AAC.8